MLNIIRVELSNIGDTKDTHDTKGYEYMQKLKCGVEHLCINYHYDVDKREYIPLPRE